MAKSQENLNDEVLKELETTLGVIGQIKHQCEKGDDPVLSVANILVMCNRVFNNNSFAKYKTDNDRLLDALNGILANSMDIHIVELKAKQALSILKEQPLPANKY